MWGGAAIARWRAEVTVGTVASKGGKDCCSAGTSGVSGQREQFAYDPDAIR